jgi:hypothetical protein
MKVSIFVTNFFHMAFWFLKTDLFLVLELGNATLCVRRNFLLKYAFLCVSHKFPTYCPGYTEFYTFWASTFNEVLKQNHVSRRNVLVFIFSRVLILELSRCRIFKVF